MEQARATAALPLLMGGYVLFYAVWFPVGWGVVGWALLTVAVVVAAAAIVRGIRQLRHAATLPEARQSETGRRRARQMGILNSVAHPVWMLGAVLLAVFGAARWIVPLIVFVVGAHFLPVAHIMGRRIDYLLGPVAMLCAAAAAVLAFNPDHHWGEIAALAGLGGAVSTGGYAWYMAADYSTLTSR